MVASSVAELRPYLGLEAEPEPSAPDAAPLRAPPREERRPARDREPERAAPSYQPLDRRAPSPLAARAGRTPRPAQPPSPAGEGMLALGLMPLRRYADLTGRARRKEFWSFMLLQAAALFALLLIADGPDAVAGLTGLAFLALLVPNIAVAVRRLHDRDISGWLALLAIIPWIGAAILAIIACFEGTRGPNRFGPDPKGGPPGGYATRGTR
jgi:uncharacterized membrane protein YhaH (DUF805 family)